MTNNQKKVLVVLGKNMPTRHNLKGNFEVIIGHASCKENIEALGSRFVDIDTLVDAGSVYEAAAFLEELPKVQMVDGTSITKAFEYKGYDMWWVHYNSLFYFFCIPYTQHKRLLDYVRTFSHVTFYKPTYESLFSCYLQAYGCEMETMTDMRFKKKSFIHGGVAIQILLTFLFLPFLMIIRRPVMVFVGDKLEKQKDYDARMRFVYEELRRRQLGFVEFLRSLESWKTVLQHAWIRKRPVVYAEAVVAVGHLLSFICGGRRKAREYFDDRFLAKNNNPEVHFRFLLARWYMLGVYDDIWSIRAMRCVLAMIGVQGALTTAMTERSFQAILGCKLHSIPTIGILHGVASRFSTTYDYMTGYDGKKMLSVDMYGVWSEWWKEHYIKESDAYRPEQLFVSGPMRPAVLKAVPATENYQGPTRVLLVAEQAAAPREVMVYVDELLKQKDMELTIKFRPVRDGFETWLSEHRPDVLKTDAVKLYKGNMQEAIEKADVVIGCHSTGVLEALLQLKVPIFLFTHKWGDYFNMAASKDRKHFLAKNPEELVTLIQQAKMIPQQFMEDLREQYFGDSNKNGSVWAVDQLEKYVT